MRIATAIAAALLAASPAQAFAQATAAVQRVTPKAYAYVPAGVTAPAPLVVLLHGAGGSARDFLDQFKRIADERRVVLLALDSTASSWPRRAQEVSDGPDAANFDAALAALSAKNTVDPSRIVLLGFSDGASHALSFGMARPKTFRAILAMSPGYAFAPRRPDPTQPIFIAHGRRDNVLPAANVREMIEGLEGAGYEPEVRWFNGGHRIDPDLLKAALDFALGK